MNTTSQKTCAPTLPLSNRQIAERLDELADRLEGHDDNPFRVHAYRVAAETVRNLDRPADGPPVADLLDVDAVYRERAGAGMLRRVAPRRFNAAGEAWLPVLRLRRHGRKYVAMYSNTALAHQQGATRDWVVIYCDDQG